MKLERELFLCDLHFPNEFDYKSYSMMLDFISNKKIDYVVIGGDLVDFKSISSWNKNIDERSLQSDILIVDDFLKNIVSRFKRSKIYYIEGNHEERLYSYLCRKAPELSKLKSLEIDSLLNLKSKGITYIRNKEIRILGERTFDINGLYHLHGHEVRMNYNVINPSKNMFEKLGNSVIFGHYHKSAEWIFKNMDNQYFVSVSTGCLSNLHPDYSTYNYWNNGFAIVEYESDKFRIYNKKIIGNSIV